MGKFKTFAINVLLFAVSVLLFLLFTTVGMITALYQIAFKRASTDYFRDNAIAVDVWGNVYCQHFFNAILITKGSINKFGGQGTISEVLGKNQVAGTLSKTGNFVANTLDKIDPGHCVNSIRE
jgi:hypothetical protein